MRFPVPVAGATRLLVLAGCRCNEMLGQRWDDVNSEFSDIRLPRGKTRLALSRPLVESVGRVQAAARPPGERNDGFVYTVSDRVLINR